MPARSDDSLWREGATPEELDAVRRLEADMANMRSLLSTMAHQRQLIANRACQRVIYWRQKKSETAAD